MKINLAKYINDIMKTLIKLKNKLMFMKITKQH